jgi:hypothetical protein
LVTVFILFRRINEFPHAGVTIRVAGGALTYDLLAMTDRVPAINVLLFDLTSTIEARIIAAHRAVTTATRKAEPVR